MNRSVKMTAHADDDDLFASLVADSNAVVENPTNPTDSTPLPIMLGKLNPEEAYHFGRLMAKMENWESMVNCLDGYGFRRALQLQLKKSAIKLNTELLLEICELYDEDAYIEGDYVLVGRSRPFELVLQCDDEEGVIDPRHDGSKEQKQAYDKWVNQWKKDNE